MTVLTGTDSNRVAAPAGYFDPVMTGGATNQGIVRYLTQDATVAADGSIVPGDPSTLTGSRAPLMTRPELDTLRYDPFDRQQMTASTIMQSSEITAPTGTALMTFGGWTADDPIVVSTEFASKHRIRGVGGQLRDLVVGDKISDLHGNKGVISLVVERAMPLDEAREQGLEQEVAWFQANPEMDVVVSPFSLISRRNAGAARELMGEHPEALPDVKRPDGTEAAVAGLGQMRFVVTHMAVDEKTKIYDDEQVRAGRGRKASSQLAWALQSQDCPAIMREFYGHNSGAESNLREYLLVTGLDMEADGTLRVIGQAESLDERPERRLIAMPELMRTQPRTAGQAPGLNTTAMRKSFGELIGDRGGDMEIPFPLTFPTGEQTETVSATSWKLPLLSSHLRSGQEFDDGSSVTHDYTRNYQDVFVEACRYRYMAEKLEEPDLAADKRTELRASMSEATARAQRSFEAITTEVRSRVLTGKNNIFKTGLMASRLSDSATMVWTADPRLDIDQVALSSVKAQQLGMAEGDHALVWRDPVLRDAGVRYMRVAIDDRLTGAAINPVMDQCFDGDFDGDAVAVVRLHTKAAQGEAMARLSVPANLLDTGVVSERGTHPFALQVSLDTQVAVSRDRELAEDLHALSGETNLIKAGAPFEDAEMTRARQDHVTEQLSAFYRRAQRAEFGSALSFRSAFEHVESVRAVCVDTGAKGSMGKLAAYAHILGIQVDDSGNWFDVDHGQPGLTQADKEASMFATAIKAHGTGLGGSFSQRAVRALRGADLKAVLEVTYPVTQSILQAKHDAAEARHKYAMLQGPGRDLWRGRALKHVGPGQWRAEMVDGEPAQATAEQWQEQFVEFYRAKDGFNVEVNPDHVARVAAASAGPQHRPDPQPGGGPVHVGPADGPDGLRRTVHRPRRGGQEARRRLRRGQEPAVRLLRHAERAQGHRGPARPGLRERAGDRRRRRRQARRPGRARGDGADPHRCSALGACARRRRQGADPHPEHRDRPARQRDRRLRNGVLRWHRSPTTRRTGPPAGRSCDTRRSPATTRPADAAAPPTKRRQRPGDGRRPVPNRPTAATTARRCAQSARSSSGRGPGPGPRSRNACGRSTSTAPRTTRTGWTRASSCSSCAARPDWPARPTCSRCATPTCSCRASTTTSARPGSTRCTTSTCR